MKATVVPLIAWAALAGCAHGGWSSGDSPSSSASDRGWRALTSTHFVLHTDQSDLMARQVVEEFERDVRVLQAVGFPGVSLPPQRIDVVLMEDAQLHELTGDPQIGGFFLASADVTDEPHLLLLVVPNGGVLGGLEQLRRVVLHEVTHSFVRRSVPRAPAWLNEGLASYWETLEIDTDSAEVIVGRPPPLGVLIVDWAPLDELVAGDKARFYQRPDRTPAYAGAWGLVHHLIEERPAQLTAYEAALQAGRDEASAWHDSFGVTPAALDRELRERYTADRPLAHRVARPPLPAIEPEAVRALEPADVRLLWARVAATEGKASSAGVRAQLAEAERLAPSALAVQRQRAAIDAHDRRRSEAGTLLERLVAEHPDDWRLLHQLAAIRLDEQLALPPATQDLPGLDPLFARLRPMPCSASALALAARFEGLRRGPETALPIAESAVARNPDCIGCLQLLAELRHARHDDAGAAEAEARAVAAWPFERPPTALLERLAGYRKGSVTARQPAP